MFDAFQMIVVVAVLLGLVLIGKLVVSILRAMKERREWDPRVRRARMMGQ